jgi:hypothetical protein
VKRERPDFLADNPHFTKRFAFYVGRRCRQASIRDVAKELKLDWETVKTLEMQYMRAQLKRAGTPGPPSDSYPVLFQATLLLITPFRLRKTGVIRGHAAA